MAAIAERSPAVGAPFLEIEGLTKVFFPEASNTVIFVIMAIVLLIRPAGLFGRRG